MVNFAIHHLDAIIILFFTMGLIALSVLILVFILRKVKTMSAATDALTAALAELQASIASLETRLSAPAPVAPPVDDEAVTRAAATVAAIKAQVDTLDAAKPAS